MFKYSKHKNVLFHFLVFNKDGLEIELFLTKIYIYNNELLFKAISKVRARGMAQQLRPCMLLQKTWIHFLPPKTDYPQLSVTPVPGDPMSSSGPHRYFVHMIRKLMQVCTFPHTNK